MPSQRAAPHARLLRCSRSALTAGLFTAVACQLVACGGAEPRASVTSDAPAATVEGAEAELARLEASLDRTFDSVGADSAGEPIPAPLPTAGAGDPSQVSKKNEAESRCENACDALASMGRSANRICELAGPGDRCEAAKSRVASASARVNAKCFPGAAPGAPGSECES